MIYLIGSLTYKCSISRTILRKPTTCLPHPMETIDHYDWILGASQTDRIILLANVAPRTFENGHEDGA